MISKTVLALVVAGMIIGCSRAFAPILLRPSKNIGSFPTFNYRYHFSSPVQVVFSSPTPEENNINAESVDDNNIQEETGGGVLDKLNSVLDTPILDANNKEDQGPIVNALKNFVRDDPDAASLTFSVVVVILMAVATRGAMFVANGYWLSIHGWWMVRCMDVMVESGVLMRNIITWSTIIQVNKLRQRWDCELFISIPRLAT